MTVHASSYVSGSSDADFFEKGDIVVYVSAVDGRAVNVGIVSGVSAWAQRMILVQFWSKESKSLNERDSTIYPEHLVRIGRIA